MATAIPTGDKNAFIAIVAVKNPPESIRLATLLVNYEDIVTCIGRQIDDFVSYPEYLIAAMATFSNNAALEAVGIYNEQTLSTLLTDPVIFINSTTNFGVVIDASATTFALLGNSYINNLKLNTNVTLSNLYVGPSSILDFVDGSASGSYINYPTIGFANNSGGRLNGIKFGSQTGSVVVQPGAYFGGYIANDPIGVCALPVTGLTAGVITHNTFELIWVPPAPGWLFINIYYKLKEAYAWIQATANDGDYVGNTGFIFRHLKSDTFYDFRVNVSCANGGISTDAIINQQTNSSTVITAGGQS